MGFLWVTFKIKSVDIKSKSGKLLKYSAMLYQWKSILSQEWEILKAVSRFTVQFQCIIPKKFGAGVAVMVMHRQSSQLTGLQV